MARPRAARGTADVLPERIPVHDRVAAACAEIFARAGYEEIRTPLFEDTSLFVRSLGEVSDVVEKEMFTCTRGDTSVTFRPEGTASVVRAYLEHHMDKVRPLRKLYYIGPMFRFERPQAGRQRQFDQIGIEALGSQSPLLDAEVIAVAHRCFEAVGLRNFAIHVNSIGSRADREAFRAILREHMQAHLPERCEDCQQRITRNVFRMLDCKVRGCQPSNQSAPRFLEHLPQPSRERFDTVVETLTELGIPHVVDHGIVRGFDYYTHLVFEVRCPDLGARDAVCGGGRYDHLIADMGGPDLGCVGFAIGVAPTLLALEKQKHPGSEPRENAPAVFVAPVTDGERKAAFVLTERLRAAGLAADTDYENRSLKALLRGCDKRGVSLLLVLGPDELAAGQVKLKDLRSGDEVALAQGDALAAALQARLAAT
jgi:histidyl-tRNA synthetase